MIETRSIPLRENFTESEALRQRAHELIPGGCHTYAKGDDQFPILSPGFITRGQGCRIWDVDGNEYIEYGMGCRAVTLGHGFSSVVEAARKTLPYGTNFGKPSPLEVACAEELLGLIDGADMAKFCKDGSTATTAAIKLARAHTGRTDIALCGDHPFFAVHDWFIGTTAIDGGIPDSAKQHSLTFRYNDIDSVRQLFADHPNQIAALILEPAKYEDPVDNFLHDVQKLCRANGTVFILDEMITGFRWHNQGGQKYYDIVPDLSAFGKALANGFALSALVGKRELMELGGLHHDKERVFLLSTTHGAETHALAAGIETMRVYQREPVVEHLWTMGEHLRQGLESVIADHGLQDYVQIKGKPCGLVWVARDPQGQPSQAYRTLFLQETIRRGLLIPSLVISYSHDERAVQETIDAVDDMLPIYAAALEDGAEKHLVGRPSKSVYRKYN